MSLLSADRLYKSHGEKVLFDHISFTITKEQRIGLIGVNGTGKSTLLKAIAGIDPPEKGTLSHAKTFHIEYLPQEPNLNEEGTVLDQIYYGNSTVMRTLREYERALQDFERDAEDKQKQDRFFAVQQKMDENDAWEANTQAKTVLTQLGITNFTQQVKYLSGGQKKRVAMAKALIQPADLLLLDEPTNHLDHETIEWLERFLAHRSGAMILVTHDRYFLDRVTNHIFELDQGSLYTYTGNYETFLQKKAEREEQQRTDEDKRQKFLQQELAWLRRGARARTTKQKARKQRVEQLQEQTGGPAEKEMEISLGAARLGDQVLEMKHVSKSLDTKTLIDDFSYLVQPGERLGIIGPNGSGKTTLLNLLAGRTLPDAGSVETGQTVKIGYYTQDQVEIDGNLRVLDYIKEEADVLTLAGGQEWTAEQLLERFMFSRKMQWTYVRTLSGGERRRLYLLRILMMEPNVLFLDEPTNDLDTQTLTILEDFLDRFPGVVITVSHDRYFLDRVVDRLFVFAGNGVIRRFEGSYTDYLKVYEEEKEMKKPTPKPTSPKKARKKLSYKEQKEWEGIEDRIAKLEQQVDTFDKEIEQAEDDVEQVQDLYQKQQETKQTLEQAIERWTELSLLLEETGSNR